MPASLPDLGDGVVCLEFHSKTNSLDADVLAMIREAIDEVEAKYDALVIGNEAENFCVGANLANLMMLLGMSRGGQVGAEAQDWRLLHPADSATMDRDRLLADAKKAALGLAASGYEPPSPTGLPGGRIL